MKIIYAECQEYIYNGKLIESTFHYRWRYGELPDPIVRKFNTFDEFYEAHGVGNKTFFRKQPYVSLSQFSDDLIFQHSKRKTFKSFSESTRFAPVHSSPTISELMNRLSADDFMNYCKDNGLNICPLK